VQESMKRKMMDKLRDGEINRLKKDVKSGRIENAEQLVSAENNHLKAKCELLQAKVDSGKVLSRHLLLLSPDSCNTYPFLEKLPTQ
jgi:hypothetical protein